MNETGNRIKTLRKLKKITQKELAEKINKSEITIRKYESGDITISIDTLKEISRALDVKLSDILISDSYLANEYLENAIEPDKISLLNSYINCLAKERNIDMEPFELYKISCFLTPFLDPLINHKIDENKKDT